MTFIYLVQKGENHYVNGHYTLDQKIRYMSPPLEAKIITALLQQYFDNRTFS